MVKKEEKELFVESIFERVDEDVYKKRTIDLLLRDTNGGKLYKYRAVNKYSLDNLKNGTLFCAIPSSLNDPFDCKMGLGIWSNYIKQLRSTLKKIEKYLFEFIYLIDKSKAFDDADYTDNEKKIFTQLRKNEALCSFIQECSKNEKLQEDLFVIISNNLDVVEDVLTIFTTREFSQSLIRCMKNNKVLNIVKKIVNKESAYWKNINSISDCARALDIYEDIDDGELLMLIEKEFNSDNLENFQALDQLLKNWVIQLENEVDQTYCIGSLGTDYKNKLMWSHYSDGHKGFCIEYDFNSYWDISKNIDLLPVLYSKKRVIIPKDIMFKNDISEQQINDIVFKTQIKSLLTKDEVWSYENEWRIITTGTKGGINIKMPPISCIYIGTLCSQSEKKKLMKIAAELHIPVKQMEIDRDRYALHAKEVNLLGKEIK